MIGPGVALTEVVLLVIDDHTAADDGGRSVELDTVKVPVDFGHAALALEVAQVAEVTVAGRVLRAAVFPLQDVVVRMQ